MRFQEFTMRTAGVALLLAMAPSAALAVRPADTLLPASTTAFVSVARLEEFQERAGRTQLGQLMDDESMQPFVEDTRAQLNAKLDLFGEKLGFKLVDLEGISAGEVSLALIERPGQEAALAVTADITSRAAQAAALLAKAEKNLAARGARKEERTLGDAVLTTFTLQAGGTEQKTVYVQKADMLLAVDDAQLAAAMIGRFAGTPKDNLKSVAAFAAAMSRCSQEAGSLAPEVRWFVNPFAFVDAWRSLQKSDPPSSKRDFVRIFREQGFDAIQGAGGFVNVLPGDGLEIVHRTSVYAPPVAGKERDPLRWNLAMRMMQLPNAEVLPAEPWNIGAAANYITLNLDVQNAFDHVDTLADAFSGRKGSFATSLKGLEDDAHGPRVNMRNEFIAHLGRRVSILMDYVTPITPESERYIYAIEAIDAAKLSATLEKLMKNDPDALKREFGNFVVWEVVEPENQRDDYEDIAPGLGSLSSQPPRRDKDERVLPNSAVSVAEGYFMVASDVAFLQAVLERVGNERLLADCLDYQVTKEAVRKLVEGPLSGWSFSRLDEAVRPSFELIRQGRMPESKTTVGRILNDMLTTEAEEAEGILRKQRIDGSKLPQFEMVRRYFGPAGRILQSEPDGWFITGAMLSK